MSTTSSLNKRKSLPPTVYMDHLEAENKRLAERVAILDRFDAWANGSGAVPNLHGGQPTVAADKPNRHNAIIVPNRSTHRLRTRSRVGARVHARTGAGECRVDGYVDRR